MADFTLKKGDRLPALRIELYDLNGPVNLAGCSVLFNYRPKNGSTVTSRTAVVEDATNGVVQYLWEAGDSLTVGVYKAEFVVTFPSGKELTFPQDSYVIFEVVDEIA